MINGKYPLIEYPRTVYCLFRARFLILSAHYRRFPSKKQTAVDHPIITCATLPLKLKPILMGELSFSVHHNNSVCRFIYNARENIYSVVY